MKNNLLGERDFFDDQARHSLPACMPIGVARASTVSNVDTNTDFSLVDVVTVAFYCSVPVIVLVTVSDVVHCVNGKRTAALSTVKSDEPTLAAAATTSHVKVALENNM